jgi:hypothetical protein
VSQGDQSRLKRTFSRARSIAIWRATAASLFLRASVMTGNNSNPLFFLRNCTSIDDRRPFRIPPLCSNFCFAASLTSFVISSSLSLSSRSRSNVTDPRGDSSGSQHRYHNVRDAKQEPKMQPRRLATIDLLHFLQRLLCDPDAIAK